MWSYVKLKNISYAARKSRTETLVFGSHSSFVGGGLLTHTGGHEVYTDGSYEEFKQAKENEGTSWLQAILRHN